MRVGDSFIADGGRFAAGVLFGLDSGADVIQEALGAINNPRQAQLAIDAAYRRGVPVIASMADEASKHPNLPGALDHTIPVNSVTDSRTSCRERRLPRPERLHELRRPHVPLDPVGLVLVGGDRLMGGDRRARSSSDGRVTRGPRRSSANEILQLVRPPPTTSTSRPRTPSTRRTTSASPGSSTRSATRPARAGTRPTATAASTRTSC